MIQVGAIKAIAAEPLPAANLPSMPPVQVDGLAAPSVLGANYFELQKHKIIRWSDKTKYITVYIEDGRYLPGWDPENMNAVRAAFTEWEQAMSPRFRFLYMPDSRGADVVVNWTTRLENKGSGEPSGTNEYQTWGKFICKNDIHLALVHPQGRVYPPQAIYGMALHEIGHMLGLRAHSDNPDDIMFAKEQVRDWETVRHLSPRDINTLHMVYAAKADYANPEGYHLANFDAFKKTQKGHKMTIIWMSMPGVPFPVPVPLPF